ncbi:MAG TPA: M56 family metallopeptidase [Thermoanaerobaculia bacterium]|nr:M56 family metallopeptidase [Thermoanaerobaculia bacterium]
MELLLVALLKASLILALAQLLVLALPALSAAMKHLLLTAGIAAFAVIPLLAVFAPAWEVTVESEVPPAVLRAPVVHAAPSAVAPEAPAPRLRIDLVAAAATLWMLVALAVIARLARTALHLRAIVVASVEPSPRLIALLEDVRGRLAIGGSVRLLRSDRIHVPMVWGVRSGTLLLPEAAEEWTDEHLRATFIHELGHLQRLDYVSLALMNLVSAVLWFHPQVWLARRRAMTEGERACDDLVLTAGERPSAYATHLLHVARLVPRREPLAALLAMSRPSQLEGRMLAILSPSTNRRPLGGKSLMISIISFVVLVVPFALVQLSAQPVAAVAPARPATPAAEVVVTTPVAPVAPAGAVAAVAPAPVTITVEPAERAPVAEPAEPVDVVAPAAPAEEAIEVSVAPIAAAPEAAEVIHVAPAPIAEPAEAAVTAAAPIELPAGIPVLTEAQLGGRPFEVVEKNMACIACTLRLARPVNTGEPGRNRAEDLATARLLRKAEKQGADAVTNLKCYRYIAIGITCPTGIECVGDAIKFTSASR